MELPANVNALLHQLAARDDGTPVAEIERRAPTPRGSCETCGKENAKLRCAACKLVSYCSKDCQKADWKQNHKLVCAAKCSTDATFCTNEFGLDHNGIAIDTPQATVGRKKQTKSQGSHHFEFDPLTWLHSRPDVYCGGRTVKCCQGETTICSIKPFNNTQASCTVQLSLPDKDGAAAVGVITKHRGEMHTHWKYQGTYGWFFLGDKGRPYGEPFGDGDRITVTIDPASGALSFLKNGVSQGVAMNGFTQLDQVYLRVYLANSRAAHPRFGGTPAMFGAAQLVDN